MADTPPKSFSFEKPQAPTDTARKPGRPKGSTNKAPVSVTQQNADVKQAIATMESLYAVVGVSLRMAGLDDTFELWGRRVEKLSETNEEALKAAPKLAHYIANVGTGAGALTFILTNAMAFGVVGLAARAELEEKRSNARHAEPSNDGA